MWPGQVCLNLIRSALSRKTQRAHLPKISPFSYSQNKWILTWDFISFSRFEISLQSKSILSCIERIVFDIASFFNFASSKINSWIRIPRTTSPTYATNKIITRARNPFLGRIMLHILCGQSTEHFQMPFFQSICFFLNIIKAAINIQIWLFFF